MTANGRDASRPADFLPLGLGLMAVVLGTAFGWDARLVDAVVTPPALVRAALVASTIVGGIMLLVGGLRRIGARDIGAPARTDLPGMIRGVRLVFLGIAAFAAAAGWLVGHPLPLVIALIIAGVDIIETSFLLLVVRRPSP